MLKGRRRERDKGNAKKTVREREAEERKREREPKRTVHLRGSNAREREGAVDLKRERRAPTERDTGRLKKKYLNALDF